MLIWGSILKCEIKIFADEGNCAIGWNGGSVDLLLSEWITKQAQGAVWLPPISHVCNINLLKSKGPKKHN